MVHTVMLFSFKVPCHCWNRQNKLKLISITYLPVQLFQFPFKYISFWLCLCKLFQLLLNKTVFFATSKIKTSVLSIVSASAIPYKQSRLALQSFFFEKPCLQLSIFGNDAREVVLVDRLIQLDSKKAAAAFRRIRSWGTLARISFVRIHVRTLFERSLFILHWKHPSPGNDSALVLVLLFPVNLFLVISFVCMFLLIVIEWINDTLIKWTISLFKRSFLISSINVETAST